MMFRTRVHTPGIFALVCLLLIATPADATPVYVEVGGSFGRGVAAMRGAECMVILPAHVVGQYRKVQIYGRGGAQGSASYVKSIGKEGDDLMLFRVDTNTDAICDDGDAAMLRAMPGAVAFRREKTGALNYDQVSITRESQLNLTFTFLRERSREAKGISGDVIYIEGIPRGIIVDVGLEGGLLKIARKLEFVAALEGSWVLGQAADVTNIRDSLDIIKTAVEMRTAGDIGQVAAIEGLVRSGSALSGFDLRGVGLAGVAMNHGKLSLAQMQGANLENANMQKTRIGEARFDFANLKNVKLQEADARKTRFYYGVVDGADLSGANASQSNWGAASARNTIFRDADLSGASFFLADLSGADFTNANLRQTSFIGAILTGARFEGAQFERTDFTAATGDIGAFSEAQRAQMCATLVNDTVRMELVRKVPSTRFSSGVAFDNLVETRIWLRVSIDALPRCSHRDLLVAGLPAYEASDYDPERAETVTIDFMIDYESDPYDQIGLQQEFPRRVYDQIKRINDALEKGAFLRFEHAQTRELTSALAARLDAVGFEGKFILNDFENITLVGLKYHPTSPVFTGQWLPKARYRLDNETRDKPEYAIQSLAGEWERFFPDNITAQELTDEHAELYRKWSLNRSKAIPSTVFLQLRMASRAISRIHNAQISIKMRPEKTVPVKPFIEFGNPPEPWLSEDTRIDPERLFIPSSNNNALFFILEQPLEAYGITGDTETLAFLRNNPQLELEMKIMGAQIIERDPEAQAGHYTVIQIAPIRLVAHASDGASMSFDF